MPSYEEVVGSGQYPIRQSNLRQSSTHLPSYEDLVEQADGLQFENEGTAGVAPAAAATAATAAANPAPTEGAAPNRRAGKTARKLLHNKIRRIKSEKLHLKNADNSQPPAGLSIVRRQGAAHLAACVCVERGLTHPRQWVERGGGSPAKALSRTACVVL